jgi:uncharacterized protein
MIQKIYTHWTANSILDFLAKHSHTLKAMGVKKIGLFGSYVREQQHAESDMDFLVRLEPFTFKTWMDVWNFLEDNLNTTVDLVPEKDLRPELRPYVLSEVRYAEDF